MSESLAGFLRSRRASWQRLQALLVQLDRRDRRPSLDEADEAYALSRAAAADLATAQLHYPGTEVEQTLAQLVTHAARVLESRPPRRAARRALLFLRHDWPALVRRRARVIGLAAGVLLGGIVLGALGTWVDPEVGAALAGEGIAAAVQAGELWTDPIEEQGQHAASSAFIFTNNIRVAIAAFAVGIAFGLGSLLLLLYNGLHLGAVIAYTGQVPEVQRGLLQFIAAHGPVELSLVAIAGGAGLWMGSALIDPGERPRAELLRERGREAVLILLGTAPFFVVIGLVEGFVSPGDLLPWPVKLALGLLLWGALLLHLRTAGPETVG